MREAVSSCSIFLSSTSFWAPSGRLAACASVPSSCCRNTDGRGRVSTEGRRASLKTPLRWRKILCNARRIYWGAAFTLASSFAMAQTSAGSSAGGSSTSGGPAAIKPSSDTTQHTPSTGGSSQHNGCKRRFDKLSAVCKGREHPRCRHCRLCREKGRRREFRRHHEKVVQRAGAILLVLDLDPSNRTDRRGRRARDAWRPSPPAPSGRVAGQVRADLALGRSRIERRHPPGAHRGNFSDRPNKRARGALQFI